MDFDRQAAMFYMLVLLVVVMGIIAVEVFKLARDIGPIANSPIARGLAGLGAST